MRVCRMKSRAALPLPSIVADNRLVAEFIPKHPGYRMLTHSERIKPVTIKDIFEIAQLRGNSLFSRSV